MALTREKRKFYFLLVALVMVGQVGVDLYLPSLPTIAKALQSPSELIKLTIPFYLLGFGVSQLFYGPLSDAWGRKPTLYFGIILFSIGSAACVFAQNAPMLIGFRVVQGLGIGSAIVNARAIMRDVFQGKQMAKISAQVVMIWATTPIIAPVIGSYIQTYFGWRANFIAMIVFGVLVVSLMIWLLPETLDSKHRKRLNLRNIFGLYKKFFTNRVFLSFALMSSFCYGYFISYATVSPFLFQTQLGLTVIEYGWIILIIALGALIGSAICNCLLTYIKITQVIFMGSLCMLIATLIMFLLAWGGVFNILSILIPPFFGSIGWGMIFPNCTVGAMTPHKKNAGVAGAVLGFIQLFNSFIFSWVVSRLPNQSAFFLSLELLVITVMIFTLFMLFIRRHFVEEEEKHH